MHTQFACHTDTVHESVSCPSFHHAISLSVHWGFNYRTTEEPHYTEREREKGLRETEETDRGETGINSEKSDPFATTILNLIIPDTTSCSRN